VTAEEPIDDFVVAKIICHERERMAIITKNWITTTTVEVFI